MGVVAFEDLSGVVVAQGGSGGAGDFEEEIHADGKVCGVEESGPVLLDQCADAIHVVVPAGGADDHVLARFHAGFDVGEDRVRSREVDDGVNGFEGFWGQRGAGWILFRANHSGRDACARRRLPLPGIPFCRGLGSGDSWVAPRRFNHRGHGGAQGNTVIVGRLGEDFGVQL